MTRRDVIDMLKGATPVNSLYSSRKTRRVKTEHHEEERHDRYDDVLATLDYPRPPNAQLSNDLRAGSQTKSQAQQPEHATLSRYHRFDRHHLYRDMCPSFTQLEPSEALSPTLLGFKTVQKWSGDGNQEKKKKAKITVRERGKLTRPEHRLLSEQRAQTSPTQKSLLRTNAK